MIGARCLFCMTIYRHETPSLYEVVQLRRQHPQHRRVESPSEPAGMARQTRLHLHEVKVRIWIARRVEHPVNTKYHMK